MNRPTKKEQFRVFYKNNPVVTGWANPSSIRDIKGITPGKIIRREIMVYWDHTYPHGYINIKEIERIGRG